jgi:AcrR family transcriptional regulator
MNKIGNAENQNDSDVVHQKRRGRPKCFDEAKALETAMLLFWEFGYEATSISDLTKALNITAPSLYGTFGDKAALFEKCVAFYLQHEACPAGVLLQSGKTAKISIELFLYDNIKRLVQEHKPKGCMMVIATMNCSQENSALQLQLKERRQYTRDKVYKRILEGQKAGEIGTNVDLNHLTDFYCTILQGMTIQARDGAELEDLELIAQYAIKAWDALIKD